MKKTNCSDCKFSKTETGPGLICGNASSVFWNCNVAKTIHVMEVRNDECPDYEYYPAEATPVFQECCDTVRELLRVGLMGIKPGKDKSRKPLFTLLVPDSKDRKRMKIDYCPGCGSVLAVRMPKPKKPKK